MSRHSEDEYFVSCEEFLWGRDLLHEAGLKAEGEEGEEEKEGIKVRISGFGTNFLNISVQTLQFTAYSSAKFKFKFKSSNIESLIQQHSI